MAQQITQLQYNTSKQAMRNIRIMVNLLDFSYRTISSFSGNVISGSLSADAGSDIRYTCDIVMVLTDNSFDVKAGGKIWLDRLVQIYVGVDDILTGETAWTNKGIYLINQPSYSYDATTNTLSFSCVDLMAKMTGMRGGYLKYQYKIPQDSSVRNAIIACLKENGFTKYVVSECANIDGSIQPVPYDMEFDVGSTWYDILYSLAQILPNYQIYFDLNGVFHYETVPYKVNEPIRMTQDVWKDNVISEQVDYDFDSVNNSVKVLGITHDINYYPSEQKISGSTLNLTIADLTAYTDGVMIGFTPPSNMSGNISVAVGSLGAKSLVDDKGKRITSLTGGDYYCAVYKSNGDKWLYLGHLQAVGEYKDTNTSSPFYIGNPAGEIPIVLYGGEYDNIQTDDLAYQRAKWEIYRRCRVNDAIQVTSVPIYWADVNWMVTYAPLGGDVESQYLIQSIHTDLDPTGNQTYEMVKYYPYYE